MTTRRDFLKGGTAALATGIVFCSCGLLHSAHAQQAGTRKSCPSWSAASGSRPSTCIPIASSAKPARCSAPMPPSVRAAAGQRRGRGFHRDRQAARRHGRAGGRHGGAVDQSHSGTAATAISPRQIVKIQNEKLAELCASKPDRFAAFASLTLQAPDLAVQELETAVKKQGLKGAAIGGVVDGVEFSDPKFHPVWAKAEELGVPLFIHPQGVPELDKRLAGNGWLGNTIGYPAGDDDRALAPDLRGHVRSLSRS